jgi:Spy/CpxP family protein refolding chaperone
MDNKKIIAGLATALFFLALSASFAQNPPEKERPRGAWFFAGERGERLASFLDLTPEQRAKFDEIRKARQEQAKAFREEMAKLRPQFREAMRDPQADQKKIDSLVDQMAQVRAGQLKSMIRSVRDMEKILTPEQLERFRDARARMGWRRGHGRAFGPRRWMDPGWSPE